LGLEKNLSIAWQRYHAAALQNHPKASLILARMAKYGEGVPKDLTESIKWLRHASEHGNGQAMFLLSNAYAAGEGVLADPAKSREWLEASAQADFPLAIQALAMELEGKNESEADTQARHLIKEASDERLMKWNRYQ